MSVVAVLENVEMSVEQAWAEFRTPMIETVFAGNDRRFVFLHSGAVGFDQLRVRVSNGTRTTAMFPVSAANIRGARQVFLGEKCHDHVLVIDNGSINLANGRGVALYAVHDGMQSPESLRLVQRAGLLLERITRSIASHGGPQSVGELMAAVRDAYLSKIYGAHWVKRCLKRSNFGAAVGIVLVDETGQGSCWGLGDVAVNQLRRGTNPILLNRLYTSDHDREGMSDSANAAHGLTAYVGMPKNRLDEDDDHFECRNFQLAPGDRLVVVDDCVRTTTSSGPKEFVLPLSTWLNTASSTELEGVVRVLIEDLADAHADACALPDDVGLIVVEFTPAKD